MGRPFRQRLHQAQLIRLLVGLFALTYVLLAVLEQAVDALGNLAGGGDHGFGAAAAALDAAIEGAQGIVGVMTTLRRHPQRAGHTVGSTSRPALEDLAAAAAMLRTQPQPTHEILLVRKGAQVDAQLAQDHQRRRLADPFNLRQVHPAHAEEQGAGTEADLVLLRLALAQAQRQWPTIALVFHAPQARLDLGLAVAQLLLIELVELERLLEAEQ